MNESSTNCCISIDMCLYLCLCVCADISLYRCPLSCPTFAPTGSSLFLRRIYIVVVVVVVLSLQSIISIVMHSCSTPTFQIFVWEIDFTSGKLLLFLLLLLQLYFWSKVVVSGDATISSFYWNQNNLNLY